MLTDVMYATIYVRDQNKALDFYTRALGLEKRVDYPGREGRFLTVGLPGHPSRSISGLATAAAAKPLPGRGP